jgi:hypothetical protein
MEWGLSNTSKGASVWSTFPRNPYERLLLVFFLLFVAILTVASAVAVMTDVKTDGYSHHAQQQTLRFS